MYNAIIVAIFYTRNNLLKEFTRFAFLQSSLLNNVVEQFSARHVFNNNENIGRSVDDLQERKKGISVSGMKPSRGKGRRNFDKVVSGATDHD